MVETGRKDDANKPRTDLLPIEALLGAAAAFGYGARKYSPWNWRKGMAWLRLYGACLRHLFAWVAGERQDPESGLSHLDHALASLMMLKAHEVLNLGTDDRPTTQVATDATAKPVQFEVQRGPYQPQPPYLLDYIR